RPSVYSTFSIYCTPNTHDIHPFPTRRSSDLPELARQEERRSRQCHDPGLGIEELEERRFEECERPGAVGSARLRCAQYPPGQVQDRKSTRLNSSHRTISYAVFCLKKKIQYHQ